MVDVNELKARSVNLINRLKVAQLKGVLREYAMSTTGLKAILVARLMEFVNIKARQGNVADLTQLNAFCQRLIDTDAPGDSPRRAAAMTNPYHNTLNRPLAQVPPGRHPNLNNNPHYRQQQQNQRPGQQNLQLNIKPSPFFTIRKQVHDPIGLYTNMFVSDRQTLSRSFTLEREEREDLARNRLSIYTICGLLAIHNPNQQVVVEYPTSFDIRINGVAKPPTFKGIKTKRGTARPVDITQDVLNEFKNGRQKHTVDVTVGSGMQNHFIVSTFLVRKTTPQEIVSTIVSRPALTKESVMRRIAEENNDEDIEAMSTTHRLKDPVSCGRITVPIRSSRCEHVDCFDAESFIMLQMQAATWMCTICNKPVDYESLALDEYIDEVLKATPADVDEFEVEPNGHWKLPNGVLPAAGPPVTTTTNHRRGSANIKDENSDSEEELFKRAQRAQQARTTEARNSMQGTSNSPIVVDMLSDDEERSSNGNSNSNGNNNQGDDANSEGLPRQYQLPRLMDFGQSSLSVPYPQAVSNSQSPQQQRQQQHQNGNGNGHEDLFLNSRSSIFGGGASFRPPPVSENYTPMHLPGGGRTVVQTVTPAPSAAPQQQPQHEVIDLTLSDDE